MKKLTIVLLSILISAMLLTACAGKPLAEGFDKAKVEASAKAAVEVINTKDGAALKAMSNQKMADALTDDTLAAIFKAIDDAGTFKSFGPAAISGVTDDKTKSDYALVILKADYDKKSYIYTISFDKEMKLAGLFYK